MEELTLIEITQYYLFIEEEQKVSCLNFIFKKLKTNQAIIFCNSARRVELLTQKFTEFGNFFCNAFFLLLNYIHAKMNQQDGGKVFHSFRKSAGRCLVPTDLITRSIDIHQDYVVINLDFLPTVETYQHRIGLSGRFGHLGLAVNFITESDKNTLDTGINSFPKKVISVDIDQEIYFQMNGFSIQNW